MRRRRRHHHDVLAGHDAAVAVDHRHADERPAFARLGDVPLDLRLGHAGIMLERQRGDRLAVLVAAADAGEGDDGADVGTPVRQLRRLGGEVERFALDADGVGHGGNVVQFTLVVIPGRVRSTRTRNPSQEHWIPDPRPRRVPE
jgi:hypothetical protein